ncbi:MAG: QcrA and Rieske domain-containing protein [Kineosporiaceae bacterium]
MAQPTAGRVVAFSAVCTHQGCRVNPAGPQLDCPCHGSVFDAFTGQVLRDRRRLRWSPCPSRCRVRRSSPAETPAPPALARAP